MVTGGGLHSSSSSHSAQNPISQHPSYKIVFLGASGVGKSSICHWFIKGQAITDPSSTVGATFHLQKLEVNGEPVKLKIWDTAGQERFSSLLPMYYKGCNGAFIVYDMTSATSFEAAKGYIQVLRNVSPDAKIILLANKADLAHMRTIPMMEGHKLAAAENLVYAETSARTGQKIQEVLNNIAESIHTSQQKGDDRRSGTIQITFPTDSAKGSGKGQSRSGRPCCAG